MTMDKSLDGINTKLAKALGYVDKIDKATKNIATNAAKAGKGVSGMAGGGAVAQGGTRGGNPLGLASFSTPPPASKNPTMQPAGGGSGGAGGAGGPGGGSTKGNMISAGLGIVGAGATAAWNLTPGARDYAANQAALFPTAFGMAGPYSNQRAMAAIASGIGTGASGVFDPKGAAALSSVAGLSNNLRGTGGSTGLSQMLGTASFSYKFMGMDNVSSAQGSVGLYQGGGPGSNLSKIGIFTMDPTSGKTKDLGQICDEIWERSTGSKSTKVTEAEFDASLLGGWLGAELRAAFGSNPALYAQAVAFLRVKVRAGGRAGMRTQGGGRNNVESVAKGLGMNALNTPTISTGELNATRMGSVDLGTQAGMQGFNTGQEAAANVDKAMQSLYTTIEPLSEWMTSFKGFLDTFGSTGEGSAVMGLVGGVTKAIVGTLLPLARGGNAYASGGTSTSDSIDAKLSHGEYVINARAAQQIGLKNLNALNSTGHNLGSAYASPAKAFAGGGTTLSGNPVLDSDEVQAFSYPGGSIRVAPQVGPLFQQFLNAWQANPLLGGGRYDLTKGAGVQSYKVRQANSGDGISDHAGWAVDIRPDILPDNNTLHMTAAETAAVHAILQSVGGGKLGWGGDYQKQENWDEMHVYYRGGTSGYGATGTTPDPAASTATTATTEEAPKSPYLPTKGVGANIPPGLTSLTYQSVMGTSLAGLGKSGSSIGSFTSGGIDAGAAGKNSLLSMRSASRVGSAKSVVDGSSGTMSGSTSSTSPSGNTVAPPSGTLSDWLTAAGFVGEHHREAWAIAMRESGGRPSAHNPVPPDDSYGLFQINMLGSLEAERNAKFRQYVPGYKDKNSLFDPLINARAAAYMSQKGANWASWVSPTYGRAKDFYDQYATSASKGMASTHAGVVNVHEGEMIVPAAQAEDFREALRDALGKGGRGGDTYITLKIERASEDEAVRFAKKVKVLLEDDAAMERLGTR